MKLIRLHIKYVHRLQIIALEIINRQNIKKSLLFLGTN